MKVCVLGDARSVHLQRLLPGLAARGLDVHLITHHPVALAGVTVERFRVPGVGLRYPVRWRGRWRRYLRNILRAFDVVNVHFLHDWGFTEDLIGGGCFVATAWGSDIVPPPGEAPPTEALCRRRRMMLRAAHGVTSFGPTFARVLARFAGLKASTFDIVPLGVDLDLFRPSGDDARRRGQVARSEGSYSVPGRCPVRGACAVEGGGDGADRVYRVGFFKGFRPVYGATYLMRAIPTVVSVLPRTRFHMIGDGPEWVRCQELAGFYGVAHAVKWYRRQPHRNLPNFLAMWDLTVISSVCESFGAAALESSAMGVPVVASDVCGLKDTVKDGRTGIRVPPAAPEALADAIIRLLKDDRLRESMGRAGRRFVARHFDQNDVVERWLDVYAKARDRASVMV